ncbi:MAG TPA: hypothetical protein VK943_06315 [Arenibaculum sp.]|nr:hypothetical protein [Arenibaculum sp.]
MSLRLFILALAPLIVTTGVQAEVCTLDQLEQANATLPAFIPADEGSLPAEVLARAFNCELVVKADQGQGMMVGQAQQDQRSEQQRVEQVLQQAQQAVQQAQQETVMLQQDHLQEAEQALQEAQQAVQKQDQQQAQQSLQQAGQRTREAYQQVEQQAQTTQQAMDLAQQALQQAEQQMATRSGVLGFLKDLWEQGLLPFKRVFVHVNSEPENARVFVNETLSGTTTIKGLLGEDYIKTLRLELDGYQPCRFGDGTYIEPAETGQGYAIFQCRMTALP